MDKIHIIGGGTFSHVRSHGAWAAPAFGETAIRLAELFAEDGREVVLHLTKMADPRGSNLVTNDDVAALVDRLVADPTTRVIVFNAAMCDFDGEVVELCGVNTLMPTVPSGKYAKRLTSRETRRVFPSAFGPSEERVKKPLVQLTPAPKVIGRIRKERKDIFVVGFKTTTGATADEQYLAGLNLLKESSLNLVLANDPVTRRNMVITPEESRYGETTDREEALRGLVKITSSRSRGTFTRSTVVGDVSDLVPWTDPRVPANLRAVVDHCIARGAYKPFRGSTAGHFAVQLGNGQFLTSLRKKDFNQLKSVGLVLVEAQGNDRVVAHGARPSVGGQSQRIVFAEHPDTDCIVHAHVPLRPDAPDRVNIVEQWPNECGSHQCGQATSRGLRPHGRIYAVMLDNHGPNIVFGRDVPAEEVIAFIERNFDLTQKTGGRVSATPSVQEQEARA